ncbi:MAG: hypothetical protein GY869_09980, partial [Planctomycetes bacterium]|nr:hypothetical protein [Planctomycetota bacterium]
MGFFSELIVSDSFYVELFVEGAEEALTLTAVTGFPATVVDDAAGGTFNVANVGNSNLDNLAISKSGYPETWEFTFIPPSLPSLPYQADQDVDFLIEVPENYEAGVYTGNLRVEGDDGMPWADIELIVTIPDAPDMYADPADVQITVDAQADNEGTATVTLFNAGNVDLTGISFTLTELTHELGAAPLSINAIADIALIAYEGSADFNMVVPITSAAVEGSYTGTITAATGDVSVVIDVEVIVTNATEALDVNADCDGANLANSGQPGDVVGYVFCVQNTGNAALDNVTLYTDFGFQVDFDPPIILDLGWTEVVTVNADVTIPTDALAGDYDGEFCARDDDDDPMGCIDFDLTVEAVCGWELANYPTEVIDVTPGQGEIEIFTFEICNTGNAEISNINIPSPIEFNGGGEDIQVVIGDYSETLSAWECQDVTASVDIPEDQFSATYSGTVATSGGQCDGASLDGLSFESSIFVRPLGDWYIDPSLIDFGDVDVGDGVENASLTIYNPSNVDVTGIYVNSIILMREGCPTGFTAQVLIGALDYIVAGGNQSYNVILNEVASIHHYAGQYNSTENFVFSCEQQDFDDLSVSAVVVVNPSCGIEIEESGLAFEMLPDGSAEDGFTITNTGNIEVAVTLDDSGLSEDFGVVLSPNEGTIAIGDQMSVSVEVTAPLDYYVEAGAYNIAITADPVGDCDDAEIDGTVAILPVTEIDFCVSEINFDLAPNGDDSENFTVVNPNDANSNNCDNNDGPGNEALEDIAITYATLQTTSDPVIEFLGTVDITGLTDLAYDDDVELTITVTADAEEITGTYETTVYITAYGAQSGNEVTDSFDLVVVIGSIPAVELTGEVAFVGDPGESDEATITVRNAGNVSLSNIHLSYTLFAEVDNIVFSPNDFTLAPDGTQEVTATVEIPQVGLECAGTYDGNITVSANGPDGNDTDELAGTLTINSVYDLDIVQDEVSFTVIDGGSQTNQFEIDNIGNDNLTGFEVEVTTPLTGTSDENATIPADAMSFVFTDVACEASELVDMTVDVAANQAYDTYEGEIRITADNEPVGDLIHVVVRVVKRFALEAEWIATTDEIIDGRKQEIGQIRVWNTG